MSGALGNPGLLSIARQEIAKQSAERERKKMIDRTAELSVGRQAKVPRMSRSNVYYEPRPVSKERHPTTTGPVKLAMP